MFGAVLDDDVRQVYPLPIGACDDLLWPEHAKGGESINDYLAKLLPRRSWTEALGKLLYLPRTGMVVVAYEFYKGGSYAVIVRGTERYPVGGYNICVSDTELATAIEVAL